MVEKERTETESFFWLIIGNKNKEDKQMQLCCVHCSHPHWSILYCVIRFHSPAGGEMFWQGANRIKTTFNAFFHTSGNFRYIEELYLKEQLYFCPPHFALQYQISFNYDILYDFIQSFENILQHVALWYCQKERYTLLIFVQNLLFFAVSVVSCWLG